MASSTYEKWLGKNLKRFPLAKFYVMCSSRQKTGFNSSHKKRYAVKQMLLMSRHKKETHKKNECV